ncbi:hypothetical protein V6Z11_1Z073200 [Gossypium hirsutum]
MRTSPPSLPAKPVLPLIQTVMKIGECVERTPSELARTKLHINYQVQKKRRKELNTWEGSRIFPLLRDTNRDVNKSLRLVGISFAQLVAPYFFTGRGGIVVIFGQKLFQGTLAVP